MSLPHVFANVSELDTPALDDNFNAVAALTVIPCTASGTNAVVLTPAANSPTISAYTSNAPEFSFEAAATSTGAMTISVSGVGAKNVYKNNGATAAGANDFILGSLYKVSYNAALNSAAGGWVILNQGATASAAGAVQGTTSKLKVQATSNTAITVTANAVAVSDGGTTFNTVSAVSLTINTGTAGANGLDTGAIGASTWYYVYVIYNINTSTTAGLISLSATAPQLPSGYTLSAYCGEVITDGSANLKRTLRYNKRTQYVITAATNTAATPNISTGAVGTYSNTTPTYTATSVTGVVPPNAAEIIVIMGYTTGVGSEQMIVAPNTSYSGINTTNPPLGYANSGTVFGLPGPVQFILEATTIAIAANGTHCEVNCLGWVSNQ